MLIARIPLSVSTGPQSSKPLVPVDIRGRGDLCCRVQLKLSACFSSSSPSMIPQIAECVHMKRNAVNSYLHLRIGHDRRLWRHPTSMQLLMMLPRASIFFVHLAYCSNTDSDIVAWYSIPDSTEYIVHFIRGSILYECDGFV